MSGFQTQVNVELPKPAVDLPVVSMIRARDFEVACPKCGHIAESWISDPRGRTNKCDECGTEYHVPGDARITFA